jgi:hypothetical protein
MDEIIIENLVDRLILITYVLNDTKKMAVPFKKYIYIILNKHAMFNLKFLVINRKCLYPIRKMMDVQCQW